MKSINQPDQAHLRIVASGPTASKTASAGIDPIAFLQAISASLELDQVMQTLNEYIAVLVNHSGWEYRRSAGAEPVGGGTPDRHRLEYALTFGRRDMGSLTLMRGRRFSETDQVCVEGLLGLAATAVHNALRFHDLAALLERDPMTGLGNRRALDLQGAQWLARAVRQDVPVSMLVMDIDRFKAINDLHGHVVGDRALCAVADALRSVTRASDLCVRLGGDEFAVLLPDTSLGCALDCAERIRQTVERLVVDGSSGKQARITLSIGVAAHRGSTDLEQLYLRADDALYAAKHAGRNRALAVSSSTERRGE